MAQDPGAGGYHWQTQSQVTRWEQRRTAIAAERRTAFAALLNRLPAEPHSPLHLLDLGAGDGEVSAVVLNQYPQATAVLVDFSEPMINKGVERLTSFDSRYRYSRWDMNEGDWPADLDEPFDAAVSSVAIHHLSNDRKAWISTAVAAHLKPGGVFANYDLFRDPDAVFDADEVHDRNCATLDQAISHLSAAGLVEIEIVARSPRPSHKGQLALLIGRKPAS